LPNIALADRQKDLLAWSIEHLKFVDCFMYMPKYFISLTHGRTVPLDILMGLQEKLFRGPILKHCCLNNKF